MISPSHLSIGFLAAALLTGVCAHTAVAQQCSDCHAPEVSNWMSGPHAKTQLDVAGELADSDFGLTPASVIAGEDCIACHSPRAVLANGGMSEAQALGYFYTTTNGEFSADTSVTNTSTWPQVNCATCHFTPTNHATLPGSLVFFNSQTKQYEYMANSSELCGQCHGNLHFSDTDHLTYNAWAGSKHGNSQNDVADELSHERVGQTPNDVIYGADAENCIACHAPTAVMTTGGDEVTALSYFFTTTNGVFSTNTTTMNTAEWPSVGCTACHNPHNPGKFSYFNSSTLEYEVMTNSDELCGQCHGNLRFPDTDHLSYNIRQGTGGIGVPDEQLMPDVTCTDCHMSNSGVDGSNSAMFRGHTWAISVPEADGQVTMSCILCHTNADPAEATAIINDWQSEYQTLDAVASANVARATAAMTGNQNPAYQAALAEAQHNLTYAESDESGGFHNHSYLMSLLQDANQKALSIPLLSITQQGDNLVISWTVTGTLQAADALTGPWHDVSGASSPLTIPITNQTQCQFYRLQL